MPLMPLSVADYLRHLAVRCNRLSRDCYDPPTTRELEIISAELLEQAQHLDAYFRHPGNVELHRHPVTSGGDDECSGQV